MRILGLPVDRRALMYAIGDLAFGLIAIYTGHSLRFGSDHVNLLSVLQDQTGASVVFLLTNALALYIAEAYDPELDFRRRLQVFRIYMAVLGATLAQMVIFYLLPDLWWGRGIAVLTNLSFAAFMVSWRALIGRLRPQLTPRRRTLILGAHGPGALIAKVIRDHPERGAVYDLVGFIADRRGDDDEPTELPSVGDAPDAPDALPVVGDVTELSALVERHQVGTVVVAVLRGLDPSVTKQLLACKAEGVRIEDMRYVYRHLSGRLLIDYLSSASLIFGPEFSGPRGVGGALQRVADVALALVGLISTAPLVAAAAVAIKLESPGPVVFTQERVGLNEQPFTIFKLRTMCEDAEAKTGPVWSQGKSDMRVTRVGRLLRKTRIDELPQFYNVLRGDMSVVGPRPEREHFVRTLKERIPFYGLRFAVKPGLTGWAQVKYRYGASEEDASIKLSYELFAIQELNPVIYILILLKTVQTVLLRPGS